MLIATIGVTVGTCRLDKLLVPPSGGLLVVSPQEPDSLPDSAAHGSTRPRRLAIQIDNTGSGVLDWNARIANGSAWLSLEKPSGTAPDTLYAFADPTGLDTTVYRDTVIVSGASGGAQLVPIRFRIYPCDVTPIPLDGAISDTLNSADCGAPHRPGRYAQVFSFAGTVNDSISIEVSADFDGYVTLDTSLAAGVPTLDEADDCIGVAGNPCLPYQPLPRNATYQVEVTSADSADSGLFTVRVVHPRNPNLPDSLDQRFSDSVTSVPIGGAVAQNSLLFRGVISDPDAWDTLRLQVEVQPVGTNFTGLAVTGPPVPNGQPGWVNVTGLSDNTSYHWRARTIDQTGRSTANWQSFGGNAEADADFTVTVPHPPNPCTALGQFETDGVTTIATGGTVDTDLVVLKCTVTDPDPGDQLRIQVEVQPVGTPFTDSPTDSSDVVSSGGIAQVEVGPLANATTFHWQARASDQTGRTSGWTSYGGNSESATDFAVSLPHVPNAPVLSQFQSNGTTSIATGGDATSTSVVLKGVVSDPDAGQTVQLQVEVQPVGTNPTGNPTGQSVFVTNGSTAQVPVSGLADSVHYHWWGRGVDDTGRPGAWVGFGSNPDTATDFRVALPPSQLVFTVNPSNGTAGSPLSPAIKVTAEDGSGNRLASFTGNVTIGFSGGSGGATLSGTKTVAAVAGIATFSDLSIDLVGSYRLQASISSPSLSATSAQFSIAAGPATQLAFTVDPSNGTAGVPISPAVVVTAQDDFGNTATSFGGSVTVILSTNPGGVGTLTGTTTLVASSGVAMFSTLSIDKPANGYRLQASSGNLAPATSASFNITAGPATHLVFSVPPSNVQAGDPITPAVVVQALDAAENVATSFNSAVTMSISTNPGGGTLTGTNPVTANNGVATFSTLSIDKTGTGYRLTASGGGFSVPSNTFDVINSPVSKTLSTITASSPITASTGTSRSTITVTARDGSNNPIQGLPVVLTATPMGGNNLIQPTAVTNAQGIATGTLSSTKAEQKVVSATIGGILITPTATVVVNPAPAASLSFTSNPTSTSAGTTINPGTGVVVTASDQFNNVATGFTGSVSIGLTGGTAGAQLSGTNPKNAVAGVATFTNLSVDSAGTGYTLQAASGGLTGATSTAFDITPGPVTQLKFTVQPTTTPAGSFIAPSVQVTAQDVVGNKVTSFTSSIRVSIGNNGGTPTPGTLSGTTSVNAIAGVASFSDLSINKSGPGYTLVATRTGLSSDESNSFDITPGPATKLVFTTPPSNVTAGTAIAPAVVVTAQDALNNTVTSFGGLVTMAFGTNAGSGTLSGTLSQTAGSGVATFPDLSIDKAASGYTLKATGGGLTQAISSTFTVSAQSTVSAGQSTIGAAPTTISACSSGCTTGGGTGSLVTVTAKDQFGNPIQGASVLLSSTGSNNNFTAAGTTNSSGVATSTFSSSTAEGKTISATLGGVPITPTAGVTVSASTTPSVTLSTASAAPTPITACNSGCTTGASTASLITVTARDGGNNLIQGATVVLSANGSNNNFTPPTTTNSSGVSTSTFTSTTAEPKTITVTINGTQINAQPAVTVNASTTPSAALSLVGAAPTTITAGGSSTITVTAEDQFGNPIQGATVVLSSISGDVTFTQPGTTNASGVATGSMDTTVSTATGDKVVSATINGVGITQTATVTVN